MSIYATYDNFSGITPADVVTSTSNIADNAVVRGDGGAKGIQGSGVLIDDSDVISGITQLNVDNVRIDGNTISSTDTDGNLNLEPNGTGVTVSTKNFNIAGVSFDSGTNTLNAYEAATWTPAFTGAGGAPTITYTTQVGYYTRIGNLVFLKWQVTVNTISGGSGQLQITGLPFTSSNDAMTARTAISSSRINWPAGYTTIFASLAPNSAVIGVIADGDDLAGSTVNITDVANGDVMIGQLIYWV